MTPRSAQQRKGDVLEKLTTEVDGWVASASASGDAYLIPLSLYWDGSHLLIATLAKSRTTRDLRRAGVARIALGPTRDVVIVEGSVAITPATEIEPTVADAHAQHTGFDARKGPEEYVYLIVTPRTIQAWRTAAELVGRVVMCDGRWLVP